MYKKRSSGWMKHLDFSLIDLICLHIAFVVSYLLHFSGGSYEYGANPYKEPDWVMLMILVEVLDFLFIVTTNSFHNVLRRKWPVELSNSIGQGLSIEVLITFALYVLKLGETYSRTVLLLTGIAYLLLTFGARLFWKEYPIGGGRACWKCRCSCGTIMIATGRELRRGSKTNCGCQRKVSLERLEE